MCAKYEVSIFNNKVFARNLEIFYARSLVFKLRRKWKVYRTSGHPWEICELMTQEPCFWNMSSLRKRVHKNVKNNKNNSENNRMAQLRWAVLIITRHWPCDKHKIRTAQRSVTLHSQFQIQWHPNLLTLCPSKWAITRLSMMYSLKDMVQILFKVIFKVNFKVKVKYK